MARTIQPIAVPQVAAPQHYVPPSPRELRAQAVHRLQIGLSGVAAMLLLVGLANIIMDRARLNDLANAPATMLSTTAAKNGSASDPLADIGVVPAASPKAGARAGD